MRELRVVGLFCVSLLVALGACSKKKSDTGVPGTLKISSVVPVSSATTNNLQFGATRALSRSATSDDLPASATNYSFAHVDGLKVTIHQVRGADAASDNPLFVQDVNEEITLTSDTDSTLALEKTISFAAGSYSGIDLWTENNWKFKGYCKTQYDSGTGDYKLVYTTASGPATMDCNTSSTCTLPDAYDYTTYDWMNAGSDYGIASTHYKFSVAASDTPVLKLLFDPTNTVACWDGAAWDNSTGGQDLVGYFASAYGNSSLRARWPDGTPAFAMSFMPIMSYVTTDSTEPAPKSRTFFAASTSSRLSPVIDMSHSATLTVLYNSSGTPLTAVARNTSGNGASNPLDADYDGFETTATGMSFYSSGWYWDGTSNPPELVRNRKFLNFDLPTTRYTHFEVNYEDGPSCGLSKVSPNGSNASRECLGSASTYWFKEAVR